MGTQLPPPEKSRGHSPQFSVHVRCDQMAGWTNMPLGVEVGLGPDDFVLKGRTAHLPQFSAHVYCGQTVGCTRISLGTEVGLDPGDIVVRWGPPPQKKGGTAPNFLPMTVVAKWLD